MVKISVCIPAYKNAVFLKRNLGALATQTFKDFEVILSDDSPDSSVLDIAEEYKNLLHIVYLKNDPAKGTPANWNYAMQHARGEYIKLIHDDDWLSSDDSLQQYYYCLEANPGVDFCFSAFYNVHLVSGKMDPVFCSSFHRWLLKRNRYSLFKRNFIGPPSAVFQRNNSSVFYDERLKWLVDFEGYIRFLGKHKSSFVYLDRCLVNIGLGEEQVTQTTKTVKEVVIPESLYFLHKHGIAILKNVWVYDYYWRMLRNFSLKNIEAVEATGWEGEIDASIKKMLLLQKKIPRLLLVFGPLSKIFMLVGYLRNR
ncbi:MAG: glycosyltransferase [Gloeobacteraceae cyanobacterium ES-bin-316]|nr:glycosyltransferase [Ferruginibacter sp.]